MIDYIAVSGSMERNVLEFVDHLHEHFLYPCSINNKGRYNVPSNATEGYRSVFSFALQDSGSHVRDRFVVLRCIRRALRDTNGHMVRTG